MGRHEAALGKYKKTIQVDPDFVRAHYRIGIAFLNLKQYEKAINSLK